MPEKVIGDLEGMAACCMKAGEQVRSLAREFGTTRYYQAGKELIARSLVTMQDAIANAPSGQFSSSVSLNGFDSTLEIHCAIEISSGGVTVDYNGTADSQEFGINVPYCYTYAHTLYPLKCVFSPRIPNNHGITLPFEVRAPEGCILNPKFPAPVNARHLTGQFLSAAVLLALSKALPEKVIAESGAPRPQMVFSGEDQHQACLLYTSPSPRD